MMAKKRTQDQDGRIPYDANLAKQWVEAAADALRVKQWNLTHAAMCVYGRTLVGFADKMATTPTFTHENPDVRRVLNTGHQQWTRQTGLPPLSSDDNWRTVAVAAGASDESLRAIEAGDRKRLDLLVERIAAWCKSRVAGVDDGWSDEIDRNDIAKHFHVSTRTIDRWVRNSSGPADISRIRPGWFRYREHRE